MTKTQTCIRFFDLFDEAETHMREMNRNFRQSAVHPDLFVLIDGPEDNYAIVDLMTAIDMGVQYTWAVS